MEVALLLAEVLAPVDGAELQVASVAVAGSAGAAARANGRRGSDLLGRGVAVRGGGCKREEDHGAAVEAADVLGGVAGHCEECGGGGGTVDGVVFARAVVWGMGFAGNQEDDGVEKLVWSESKD